MHAFIDESGNTDINLSHDGASQFFIITAIILDEQAITDIEASLNLIAKKHFSNGPIKSSSVGNNDNRRLAILDDISRLDFTIFTLVVDKSQLKSKGFTYKTSFYKFLNGKLHESLYKSIPDLYIFHDSYGDDDFRYSFKEYIQSRHIHDLFSDSDFCFIDSDSSRLIQLADFICGCYARIYETTKRNNFEKKYRELLSRIKGIVEEWPQIINNIEYNLSTEDDMLIENVALHTIFEYLGKYQTFKDDDVKNRVYFLNYLYYYYKYHSKYNFIYTNEIRRHLNLNNIKLSDYQLRSKIVAPLRDEGILISSSSHGYKIPVSKQDIIKYIQHSNSIIIPMKKRLSKLRNVLLIGSGGKVDISKNDYGYNIDT